MLEVVHEALAQVDVDAYQLELLLFEALELIQERWLEAPFDDLGHVGGQALLEGGLLLLGRLQATQQVLHLGRVEGRIFL